MNGRKLSLALLVVLCGSCLIAPPNVFGENPWDPDKPGSGGDRYDFIVDTSSVSDTTIIDTTIVNGSISPPGTTIQPQTSQEAMTTSWVPYWLREFLFFSGLYLIF